MAEELPQEAPSVPEASPLTTTASDPRGRISLLAPILNPRDQPYQTVHIVEEEDKLLVPPGEAFTFTGTTPHPDSGELTNTFVRGVDEVPFVARDTPEFNDLPIGAFFYFTNPETSEVELHQKEQGAPTSLERIGQRLFGTDIDARGFGVEIPRIVSTVAGSYYGSKLGAQLGARSPIKNVFVNPVTGALVLGAAGAAISSIAPEQTMEWGEGLGVLPEGFREKYGYSDEELRTLFMGEGLLDLAFGTGFTVLRGGGRPLLRGVARIGEEGQKLARLAAQRGVAMLPVSLGEFGTVARGYVPVMGRFPWFGGPFKRQGKEAVGQFTELIQGLPSRLAPLVGVNDLSKTLFSTARTLVKQISDDFGTQYDDIFRRATESGIHAVPTNSIDEALRIKQLINESLGEAADGSLMPPSSAQKAFLDFINEQILPMSRSGREGMESLEAVPQTLQSMDGLLSRLDDVVSVMRGNRAGKIPDGIGVYYSTLQQQIKADVVGNLVQRLTDPTLAARAGSWFRTPQGATGQIGKELGELDAQFAVTMNSLFETSASLRVGSVRGGGLRASTPASREAMKQNVDTLAETLMRVLPKSPESVFELKRLLTRAPGGDAVFRQIGAEYLDKIIKGAFGAVDPKTGVSKLNLQALYEGFGLNNPNGPQYKALEALLSATRGAPKIDDVTKIISMPELATVMRIGDALSSLEIPAISTFIARRATLGGLESIKRAIIPGMSGPTRTGVAVGVVASVGQFVSTIAGVATTLVALGGGRLFSEMLSNPSTALPLREVLEAEAKGITNRKAGVQLIRGVIRSGGVTLGWTADEVLGKLGDFDDLLENLEESFLNPATSADPTSAVIELEEELLEEETQAAVDEAVELEERSQIDAPSLWASSPPLTETVPRPAAQFTDPNLLAAAPQMAAPAPPAGGGVDSAMRERYAALYPNDMVSTLIDQGVGSLPA